MKRESFLLLSVLFVPILSQVSPSRVQGVTVTRTVQGSSPALRVSWSAVNGSGITYTVCYNKRLSTQPNLWSAGNCGTRGIYGTSATLGPLSGGTTYLIWVVAVSSGRQGLRSNSVQQKTCDVPSRPTVLAVFHQLYLPSEVGISVTWMPPQSDCPITFYEVQYKISSDTSWSTPPVSKSSGSRIYSWRGLSPITSYDVRVRAVSAAGKGAWSDVGQATTPGVLTQHSVCQPQDDNTGLIVGVLIGGMAIGAVTVLLVVGIVCGVCKLRQHPKQPTSEQPDNKVEAIYDKVDESTCPDVTMTTSPAYEGVKIK